MLVVQPLKRKATLVNTRRQPADIFCPSKRWHPIKAFDEALFKATIKSITVEITGQLRFELINGVMLSTSYKLRGKGGKAHGDGTKNSIGNPCKSDL